MPARTDPSASYAVEVARLLWPPPWEAPRVTRGGDQVVGTCRDAYLFPTERRPRLLVPADLPGASTMLRRLGADRSALAGPARQVLRRAVRARAFPLLGWPMLRVQGDDPDADSVEGYLSRSLRTDVRVGVLLGTRRANQKPVLQVFSRDGTVLGYAKVGHNDLTAGLVRREAAAVATVGLHLPRSFRLPEVLHEGRWAGLEVLVLSPLTTDRGHAVPRPALVAAMREVAWLVGVADAPLAESGFWSRIRGAASAFADGPDSRRLQHAVSALEQQDGAHPVGLGGWHGDWGPWNMGTAHGELQVWDWERYDPEVPLGFDALHFGAQGVRPGDRAERRQERAFLRSVPSCLAELGVHPAQHDLTLRLYLVEIAVRYLDALRGGATPALRRRTSWVLTLLEHLTDQTRSVHLEARP
jgi:hypothetical protein